MELMIEIWNTLLELSGWSIERVKDLHDDSEPYLVAPRGNKYVRLACANRIELGVNRTELGFKSRLNGRSGRKISLVVNLSSQC